MILEYYVMRNDGRYTMWLTEGEWTQNFSDATAFTSEQAANAAAHGRLSPEEVYYVMGCMASE